MPRKGKVPGSTDHWDSSDFSRFQATGANFHGFNGAFKNNPQFFEVRVPPSPGGVFGVADIVPEHRAFVAHITSLGHS